ncbi:japanin-like-RA2 [Dermacentor variabilis]|uniref:japanin-like-RA2 n=1 Tax=Dermacentor variabilis TaxID=34621 RepID=UPI003F5BBDD1
MYIRLLAPFALCAFVFANDYIEAEKHYPYEIPANSSETLYLVGYSSALNHSNIMCVKSEKSDHFKKTDEGVRRLLSMNIYNQKKSTSEIKVFVTVIYIPDGPFITYINITELSGELTKLIDVLPKYLVIHYDSDTMILANTKPVVSEQALCSLWVTNKYFREKEMSLPVTTRKYWHSNCKNAAFLPYPNYCFA